MRGPDPRNRSWEELRRGQSTAPNNVPRTGIVFVHGIGAQVTRETLFDWARPIIDVFGEWRREYDRAHPKAPIGENPVGSASVSDPSNPLMRSTSRSSATGVASSGCSRRRTGRETSVRRPSPTRPATYSSRSRGSRRASRRATAGASLAAKGASSS